jgi:hypothetical protein
LRELERRGEVAVAAVELVSIVVVVVTRITSRLRRYLPSRFDLGAMRSYSIINSSSVHTCVINSIMSKYQTRSSSSEVDHKKWCQFG